MQTIHKICLILTGVCVVILCVGIGLGIVHGGKSNSNGTFIEYEAYDEDYVDYDSTVASARVIVVNQGEQGTREMSSLLILNFRLTQCIKTRLGLSQFA